MGLPIHADTVIGAALTGTASTNGIYGPFQSHALRLMPAQRCRATEGYPLYLAPDTARIVAVGSLNHQPWAAVAWVSDQNEVFAAVESDRFDLGREVLIRIWTSETSGINRAAVFQPWKRGSVAVATFGPWNGLPVAGVALFPLGKAGDEC